MHKQKSGWVIMAAMLAALMVATGCLTRGSAYTKKTLPDGTVIESRASIVGTGDKASEVAAEGLFADGTDEDLGAGFKNATASQQSTGIDGTLNGLANLIAALERLRSAGPVASAAPSAAIQPEAAAASVVYRPPAAAPSTAPAGTLADKLAEAKAAGKPLVVLAGNTGCSICASLDRALDADAAFLARADIVFYRETSAWSGNAAAKWTGPGDGRLPVLRVTRWDASGAVLCDQVINRPRTVADIAAAINACSAE